MMITLSLILTTTFFGIYVFVLALIGYSSSKDPSEDDFMLADRKVSGFQLIASLSAGYFDGVTLSVYIAYVYDFGAAAIALFIGLSVGFLVFRQFAPRIKAKADEIGAYSMPEFFLKSLGKRNAVMISLFLLTQYTAYLLVNFILAGKVFSRLFPGVPYPAAVAVGAVIISVYLLYGGFKAVVRTDFFQFAVMIAMTLIAAAFFAPRLTLAAEDFSLGRMGTGNIIGFLVLSSFSVMVGPDIWQRAFAAKDTAALKDGLRLSSLVLPLLAAVITVVGLATKQNVTGIPADNALIEAFSRMLPIVVMEFMLVLLYAVSLSSSDTATFVLSSIVTRDLKNYTSRFSEASMIKLTRIVMVGAIVVTATVAMAYQEIVQIAFAMASLNLGLVPVVFASFFFKLDKNAVFVTLVLSALSVVALAAAFKLDPNTSVITLPVALLVLPLAQGVIKLLGRPR